MAKMNFGGVEENVITREEFPLSKALEVLKDETLAVIGYGVQGPGQALNLKDNGFKVIVGQRKTPKPGIKRLLTVGYRARRCSKSMRLVLAAPSFSICSPMLHRSQYGRQ